MMCDKWFHERRSGISGKLANNVDFHRSTAIVRTVCVQSVLTYETETQVMKAEILHSLERIEGMMLKWMCDVS